MKILPWINYATTTTVEQSISTVSSHLGKKVQYLLYTWWTAEGRDRVEGDVGSVGALCGCSVSVDVGAHDTSKQKSQFQTISSKKTPS